MNALLVAMSVLLGIAAFETLLRLVRFSYPPFHRPDPVTGLSFRPGVQGWFEREGRAFVRINSNGFRDRERALRKPSGTYRIAVLGDSYAEALQVEEDQTFWRKLEVKLPRCGFQDGKRIDVMNFGVSGFGTGQELRMLETHALKFGPDLILLAFFPGNDVRNNSSDLEEDRMRPFYRVADSGSLILDDSFSHSDEFMRRASPWRQSLKNLSMHLRTLQLVYQAKDALRQRSATGQHETIELGLDDAVFRPPEDPAWRSAWNLTESLLLRVNEAASSANAEFVVAVLSVGVQVTPDRNFRESVSKKLGVADFFYPERRLTEFGRRAGIHVIPLGARLRSYAETNGAFLHGFPNTNLGSGHWNEKGHEIASQVIADALCSRPSPDPEDAASKRQGKHRSIGKLVGRTAPH